MDALFPGIASPLLSSYYFIDILIVSSSQDKSEPAKACVCKNKVSEWFPVVFLEKNIWLKSLIP